MKKFKIFKLVYHSKDKALFVIDSEKKLISLNRIDYDTLNTISNYFKYAIFNKNRKQERYVLFVEHDKKFYKFFSEGHTSAWIKPFNKSGLEFLKKQIEILKS